MLLHIMLYVMIAYLMLLAALFKAVCLYNALFLSSQLIFANAFCFISLHGLLTNSLFIPSMIFYHAQCFKSGRIS